MDFLTPQVFDALIITNIVIGVLIAGRKFYKDVTGPLPPDAPRWAREQYQSKNPSTSPPTSDNDS